jgi:8-oxo-dGTP pyrophosphatase MutT (NUDIX family)
MVSLQRFEEVPAVNVQELLTRPEMLHAQVRAALAGHGATPRPLPVGVRRAAVLLLLVQAEGEAALLLTQRSQAVERHKGQISLPGGVVEPGESPLDAALRETAEEIGVREGDVTILGGLDEEETVVSGFRLAPFVGSIPYPYPLHVSTAEVLRVLEVPVRTLLDPRNLRSEQWTYEGAPRTVYFFSVNGDLVWGATARVITQFLGAVFPVALPPDDDRPVARRNR